MNDNFAIQLFEGKNVRIVWDAEKEKYYFAVADIVQILTDTVNSRDYIKKMLRRDSELKSKWGTICTPVEMLAPDGKHRKTQAADLEGILRIIQAIPSKKAEPVKQWLAEVGAQRIDQMIDPEQTFQMAVEDFHIGQQRMDQLVYQHSMGKDGEKRCGVLACRRRPFY